MSFNHSSFDASLNYIKQELSNQREQYLNLLNQNTNLINSIDHLISVENNYRTRQTNFQSSNNLLTSDEVLTYTSAVIFSNVEHPLNDVCPLSNYRFRMNEYVCKLPCGHLFDGHQICYNLTHVSTSCPICHVDVRQNSNSTRPVAAPPPRTRRTTRRTTTTTNTSDFVTLLEALMTIPLTNTSTTTNTAPTTDQIQQATELIAYENIDNPSENCCPISHEEFEPESIVCRIKHCKHIFKPEHLNRWFETSSLCPVCRHNIIESNTNTTATVTRTTDPDYYYYSYRF